MPADVLISNLNPVMVRPPSLYGASQSIITVGSTTSPPIVVVGALND